jgi:hypothetical protein
LTTIDGVVDPMYLLHFIDPHYTLSNKYHETCDEPVFTIAVVIKGTYPSPLNTYERTFLKLMTSRESVNCCTYIAFKE